MSSSVVVDTNVLIYAIDADSKFHKRALKIILDPTIQLFTTSKNISEFLVVLTRNKDRSFSTHEYLEALNSLLTDVNVLYSNPTTFNTFQDLIVKYNPRVLWIHDVEIASIAIAYGIPTIVTNNVSNFKRIEEIEVLPI